MSTQGEVSAKKAEQKTIYDLMSKKSIYVDMTTPRGLYIFKGLVSQADITKFLARIRRELRSYLGAIRSNPDLLQKGETQSKKGDF